MSRLQKFREILSQTELDGIIISSPENRRYLSGFTGSAGVLLISSHEAVIVTDFRYWEQVGQEVKDFELHRQGLKMWPDVTELTTKMNWRRIGFEAEHLTYQEYLSLAEHFKTERELVPMKELVEKLRAVKDPEEIAALAEAARITDQAWEKAQKLIKPGVTEQEIATEFDYQLRRYGAEGNAFTTIVASGPRSALPHGIASDKKLAKGEFVLLDGGGKFKGYHADLTRTVVLGRASDRQREIYGLVLKAQEIALQMLKSGLIGKAVDGAARDFLTQAGYGEQFGHGLGHSVGLKIHETPRLSVMEENQIPAGTAITVEPGIYIPDWGGVRIEDLVVVEQNGIRNLTGSPKSELVEI